MILTTLMTSYVTAQKQSFINKDKLALLKAKAKETKTEALIIYENNKLVLEAYDGYGHRDSLIQPWSCTKSIVGLTFIALLDDGLLDSIDQPVHTIYPEWNQGIKKDITVKHLLTMTSGLQNEYDPGTELFPSSDIIQLALSADVIETPGTIWRYNNKAFSLLAGVVQKLSGKPMDVYIKERLFKPLNITHVKWERDENKTAYSFAGCHLKPMDLAKLGLLVGNKGSYNGKKVLSEKHLSKIHQPIQTRNYGLGWWIDYYPSNNPDEYTSIKKIQAIVAAGSYGNVVVVIPDKKVVAVRLVSYKTYGAANALFDLSVAENGPTWFEDFQRMVYDMVK